MKSHLLILLIISFLFLSCDQFLDLNERKNQTIPNKLLDLEELLNNRRMMNANFHGEIEGIADNYFVSEEDYKASTEVDRKIYTWDPSAQVRRIWSTIYTGPIYYSNIVLDQLEYIKIEKEEQSRFNHIKGSALFFRSYNYFIIAQMYCEPYQDSKPTALGIPLRMTASVTAPIRRNTLGETYNQIIKDLKLAAELLPISVVFATHPKRAAAYAALSRVYLSMGKFEEAYEFANLALRDQDDLIDFNNLKIGDAPFTFFNSEQIFINYATANFPPLLAPRGKIDTLLFESYNHYDLRKSFYFRKGSTSNYMDYFFNAIEDEYGNQGVFGGLTTSEIYLNRAEASIRLGRIDEGMQDLTHLLQFRFKNNSDALPLKATNQKQALKVVLDERRKELVNRGLRWMDLRRLNLLGENITITRKLGDQVFELPPHDLRWTCLIPETVVEFSKVEQNKR